MSINRCHPARLLIVFPFPIVNLWRYTIRASRGLTVEPIEATEMDIQADRLPSMQE